MRLPRPTVGFYLSVPPTVLLCWTLVSQQTVVSWKHGPQMVGWALIHSGIGVLLILAMYAALAWAAVTALIAIFSRTRRNMTSIAGAVIVAVSTAMASAPYGFWVSLFADRIAGTEHATEFLVWMAATDEISAVQALLDAGVPINESDRRGIQPIEAAENVKRPEMEFLRQRGGTDKRF